MKIYNITTKYNPYFKQKNYNHKPVDSDKIFQTQDYTRQQPKTHSILQQNQCKDEFNSTFSNLAKSSNDLAFENEYKMLTDKMNHSMCILGKIYTETSKVKDLNPDSRIFNIIRKDYPEFDTWLSFQIK